MESEFVCLGLEVLGKCSYNPDDPKSYFTLGNLLSVLALILAITQLTKPIIEFRIRSHNTSHKGLIILVIVAIICIFIATILPFIPGEALPLIGYPVFWELMSAILFVTTGIFLIFRITRTARFTSKNAEPYLNATISFIAKGGEERLNGLAEEIYPSISSIINEARKYDPDRAKAAKRNNERYEITKTTRIANTILDIWSDKLFCESIVCRSPASAIEIITNLAKYPHSGVGYALSHEIINQSFENSNSLLNREESYSGLGFLKKFMHVCFGNWRFVEGVYRPLQSWEYYRNTLTECKVEKFCECTNIAFESFVKSKDYWSSTSSLNVALDTMTSLTMYQVTNISHISKQEIYSSKNQKILSKLSQGYQTIIDTVLKEDDYPVYEFDAKNYESFKDNSIFGVIAKGIYKYFEMLAVAKGHDSFIREYAISIWLDIFGVRSSKMSRNQEEIGKRLLLHIKKKVNENLDHEQRWYPAITRLLLSLNGISESDDNDDDSMSTIFHKEFLAMIKEKFPLIYQAEKEFAINMLPESIRYEPESNKLILTRFRGETTELILNSCTPSA